MKNNLLVSLFITAIFILTTSWGCGKTGDPRPAQILETRKLSTLFLDQSECGVILTWNLAAYRSAPELLKIYRTDYDIDGGDCPTCPGKRRLLAELTHDEMAFIREYDGSYVYFDRKVQEGFLYRYAIVVCGHRDVCSEPSEESEIRFTYSMEHCP